MPAQCLIQRAIGLGAGLRELKALGCAWPFLDPVPVDQVPGYAEAIAMPMDLPEVIAPLKPSRPR